MRIKNFLNIILYTFIIVVPLVPVKVKVSFIPVAADTVFGGIAILLGIICIVVNYFKDKSYLDILKSNHMKIIGFLILIFAFISIGSVLYAQNKSAVISEAIRFIEYALIFYIILIVADKDFIKKALIIFYIVMIISALFGAVQFIFNLSSFFDDGVNQPFGRGRIYSTFENPNYFGAAMNIVIFYPLICFIEKKGSRIYNAIIFLLFLFNLVFTSTRGAWLGFALGVLVISVIRYRKMLLGVPVFLAGIFIIPSTRARFLSIFDASNVTDGTRVKIWKTGIEMFKDHPILGIGNGNFIHRYREYILKHNELNAGRTVFTTHNSYLKMFAELGAIGGVLFLMIYASLTYMTFKVYKFTKRYKLASLAFIGFWAAYLFQNFLNNLMFIPQLNVLVWIITAMLYKGYYIENMEGELSHE